MTLASRILSGERAAAARAITLIENGAAEAQELLAALAPHSLSAYRVGVTGPPGAGKSTLVDGLARTARKHGETVGVVAIDPSSPFSGGAVLGDRVRMAVALEDPEVFVRSMAARGCLGGLSRTAQEAADVLAALGKSFVCFETVGVGQSELSVAQSADTCVVVLVPEAGGMVQALKAGLMEIADIFVVNKADRPGADEMQRQLWEAAGHIERDGWRPPVLETVALEMRGLDELYDKLQEHRKWLQDGGRLEKKRQLQFEARIRNVVRSALEERLWRDAQVQDGLKAAALQLQSGEVGLLDAAAQVWKQVQGRVAQISLEGIRE